MATEFFENIVNSNFGGKVPSKAASYAKKSDSSEFHDLVKDKTLQSKIGSLESVSKKKDGYGHNRVAETRSAKKANIGKEQEVARVSSVESTDVDHANIVQEDVVVTSLPIVESELLFEEVIVAVEQEGLVREEELDQLDGEIIPFIHLPEGDDKEIEFLNSANSSVDEETIIMPVVVSALTIPENSGDINNTNFVPEPSVISKLPTEDQMMHQNLKTFDLPSEFTSSEEVWNAELLAGKPQIVSQSEDVRKLEELSSKFQTPIKIVVENEFGKNVIDSTKPTIVAPPLNLALADTTRHGRDIISKMQTQGDDQSAESVSEIGKFVLDNEAIFSNLSDKDNSSAGQKSSSSLETFGALMERVSDETFEITFKGHDVGPKRTEMPKLPMQVSLAVSEVLNSSSESGKKQITINLHPQTLGSVKVEILSQVGHDGASKVESIKISADKHETLVMLEERKMELSKSLKEVNGSQEKEAFLQFEMSQEQGKGQGGYFSSLEERNNWMSKFVGLVADDSVREEQIYTVDEYATRGIVTEDKVDLIA